MLGVKLERPVLIGVLLNNISMLQSTNPGRTRLEMLSQINKKPNVQLFVFSLKDVDCENKTINGAYYDHVQGCWMNRLFPLPDVLYDREVLTDSLKSKFMRFQKVMDENNTQKINNLNAFNKWDVYQVLSREKELTPNLPKTFLYREAENKLFSMLRCYGRVYLKACRGRQGREVMQVIRLAGGIFECRYYAWNTISRKVPGSMLKDVIRQFFKKGESGLIIQQPIDLLEIEGRIIDLRAEVQRNGRGRLEVVAVPVRVGGKNSPITTHAQSYRFEEFFGESFEYDAAALGLLKKRINLFLRTIYQAIEKHYGPFGEIGIDIGLDKNNKLWFIECNAQPAKVSLMQAYSGPTVNKALLNPVEYAMYIAGLKEAPPCTEA